MKETVLIYIEKDNKYLLIHKVNKDMNFNKYSGVGGKLEKGETPIEAAIRETKEETGLSIIPIFKGIVNFHSNDYVEIMYLYKAYEFEGIITPSDEGELIWYDKEKLDELPMWEGDYIFLKKIDEPGTFELSLYYEGEKLVKVI